MTESNYMDKKKPFSVGLSGSLIDAIKTEAKRREMSTSALVEKVLKKEKFYKQFKQINHNGSN